MYCRIGIQHAITQADLPSTFFQNLPEEIIQIFHLNVPAEFFKIGCGDSFFCHNDIMIIILSMYHTGLLHLFGIQFLIIRPLQFFHCCLCPLIHLIKLFQKGKFKLTLGNNFSCKLPDLFQFTIMPSVFFICFGSFRYPMFQFITHNDM